MEHTDTGDGTNRVWTRTHGDGDRGRVSSIDSCVACSVGRLSICAHRSVSLLTHPSCRAAAADVMTCPYRCDAEALAMPHGVFVTSPHPNL